MADLNARQTRLVAERDQVLATIATEEAWQAQFQAWRDSRNTSKFSPPPFCTQAEAQTREGKMCNARMRLIEIDKDLAALI